MFTGFNRIKKKGSISILIAAAVLFLSGCEKDDDGLSSLIMNLETGTDLDLLKNFSIEEIAESGQLKFITCEKDGNKQTIVPYKITGGVAAVDTSEGVFSPKPDTHYTLAVKKFPEFWMTYHKVSAIAEINSLDGTQNCGTSLVLNLKSGTILVKSKVNMDNLFGFQYKRKKLKNDWAMYKIN